MRLKDVVLVCCMAVTSCALFGCDDNGDVARPNDDGSLASVWALSAGGSSVDNGLRVATDGDENVLVSGIFTGSATFDDTTLTAAGLYDSFVAKYDEAGALLWVQQGGGTGNDWGYDVATDGSGNVFMAGAFEGAVNLSGTTLTSAGQYDVFVAKYDPAGKLLWAKSAGGSGRDWGYGVATDGSGNVVVTGYFTGSVTFGGTTLTSEGGDDVFVVKYDAAGAVLWAQSAGGLGTEAGTNVATDGSGNVIVTGPFMGSVMFGGTILTSEGDRDVFVAKYSSTGTLLWALSAGGAARDWGLGVATDGSGNVVMTGYFQGVASFGGTELTSAGMDDVFVAKYDAAGTLLWVHSAGGSERDAGGGVGFDGSGNVVMTGYFRGVAAFGGTTLTSAGTDDVFVAKYNPGGALLWVHSAGGSGIDGAFGVDTDGSGNVVMTGYFQGGATFGSTTLTSAGGDDVFVARMRPDGSW